MNSLRVNVDSVYRIVGRYKDGAEVVAYHVAAENGDNFKVDKSRLIYMIGRGMIENAKAQPGVGGDAIVRGFGINLNTLPIYDERRQEIRNGCDGSQLQSVRKLGQYEITHRIVCGNNCVGYVIKDASGKTFAKKRGEVMELAKQKMLTNATIQRLEGNETTPPRLILRKAGGGSLVGLPIIIVDEKGKIIESKKKIVKCRAARMNKGGKLIDTRTGEVTEFLPGEYLVCYPLCNLKVVRSEKLKEGFIVATDKTDWKDEWLEGIGRYKIETLNGSVMSLTKELALRWTVLEAKS